MEHIIRSESNRREVRELAQRVKVLRAAVSAAFDNDRAPGVKNQPLEKLEAAERDLRGLSPEFAALSVISPEISALERNLPPTTVYLDYNVYVPADYHSTTFGPPRLSVLFIKHGSAPRIIDLGDMNSINRLIDQVQSSGGSA